MFTEDNGEMTHGLKGSTRPNPLEIIGLPVPDHNLSKHRHKVTWVAITPGSNRPPKYYTPPTHDLHDAIGLSNWYNLLPMLRVTNDKVLLIIPNKNLAFGDVFRTARYFTPSMLPDHRPHDLR